MLSSDVKDFVIVTNVPENGARFPYLPVHSDNWLRRYAWLSSSLPTAVETPTPVDPLQWLQKTYLSTWWRNTWIQVTS